MIGKILNNRYEILELVGQGGMASVYLGIDKTLNRNVAIKVLKSEFVENEQFLKKFEREAQAAAKLSHPHIVSVYDTGNEDDIYYIIMEYVDGKTLKDYIVTKGKLSYKESINYTLGIASALMLAHKNNIIHRDVKPHNILLTKAKRMPKVADFGIARGITSTTVTMTDETMGSVHYISPEQARGGFLDERSDLYSLGILMYEMISGTLPFDSDSPVAVALKQIQEDVPPLESIDENMPKGISTVVKNLTNKSPRHRYQNAQSLIQDLKALREDLDVEIVDFMEQEENNKTNGEGAVSNIGYIERKPRKAEDEKPEKEDSNLEGEKKKFKLKTPHIIGISVAALLLIIGIVWGSMFLFAKDVVVPDVVGMNIDEAIAEFEEADVKYSIVAEENSLEVEKDNIISQDIQAGQTIKSITKVGIVVSLGPKETTMPDVLGLYEEEAVTKLENEGFVVKEVVKEFQEDKEKDKVYMQNPSSGVAVLEGSEVTIYISKGEDSIVMESLVGKSLNQAKEALTALGLSVGSVEYVVSEQYDKDIVISHSPKEYEKVKTEGSVDLVVSKGKLVSKSVTINLGDYISSSGEEVTVKVELIDSDNNVTTAYSNNLNDNEIFTVTLKGYGVAHNRVIVNGREFCPVTITF